MESRALHVRSVLSRAVGAGMAETIIVGTCNILGVDEQELEGENLDLFLRRLEIVLPAIVGAKAGVALIDELEKDHE